MMMAIYIFSAIHFFMREVRDDDDDDGCFCCSFFSLFIREARGGVMNAE